VRTCWHEHSNAGSSPTSTGQPSPGAEHVQARDLPGLLGGLALGVVEVCRDGDHRVGDLLTQVGLSVPVELLQDERAELLGAELLPSMLTVQSVPICRLTDRTVRSTLVTACRLATSPTITSAWCIPSTCTSRWPR
jgi:hypothetical protein